jgi:GNAT superfamily N-acetyltransferase
VNYIPTVTTYLEMRTPCMPRIAPPCGSTNIERLGRPSVEQYRFLYNSVGADYCWVDRNVLPDDDLKRILADEAVEVYVLEVAGEPAGFAELDRRKQGEIELAYFGLFPRFIGRGLGKYLLSWILHRAWSCAPGRVWVHTCDLDHPAALHTYLQAGFGVYDRKIVHQAVPVGLSPGRTPRPQPH